jgi:1-deoxy-D-xylulose-5-phosphate synthase
MTVTAPKNGTEMLGLLRTAAQQTTGPFSLRYPRDASPDVVQPISEIAPVPYGTWEVLRKGREIAILAVGTMVLPSVAAAEKFAEDGINATVVNCRFLKPHDHDMLKSIVGEHRQILVVEEGTVVNGFGAHIAAIVSELNPAVQVIAHGVPDKFIEQASRARQLALVGLDAAGIAARVKEVYQPGVRGAQLRAG